MCGGTIHIFDSWAFSTKIINHTKKQRAPNSLPSGTVPWILNHSDVVCPIFTLWYLFRRTHSVHLSKGSGLSRASSLPRRMFGSTWIIGPSHSEIAPYVHVFYSTVIICFQPVNSHGD